MSLELESVTALIGKHRLHSIINTGEMSDSEIESLTEYYVARQDMPIGVQQGDTGTPDVWIYNRLYWLKERKK